MIIFPGKNPPKKFWPSLPLIRLGGFLVAVRAQECLPAKGALQTHLCEIRHNLGDFKMLVPGEVPQWGSV